MNKPQTSNISGKRRRMYRFVLPILLILSAAGTASAQTAQVTGIVTDTASAAVPNAEVIVTNIGTGINRKVVTNEEGTYTIPFLRPDIYRITVRATGFGPVTREGVSLSVEQVARLDFTLQVGAIQSRR